MKKQRNYNVEAFRCLLMFLIVVRHAFIRGDWAYIPEMWTLAFLCFLSWHVPSFVSISGWFGINFSWRKFINLFCLMAFYSLPGFLLGDWRITGGWFGACYLSLMLMSPIINAGIDALAKTSLKKAWGGGNAVCDCDYL